MHTPVEVKKKMREQVRDSFTFPAEDHELIQNNIGRCLQNGVGVNKSEALRAYPPGIGWAD